MDSLYFNGKHHCALYKGEELVWQKEPNLKVWSGQMEEPERSDITIYIDKPEHWAWLANKVNTTQQYWRDKIVELRANLDFNNIPMFPLSACHNGVWDGNYYNALTFNGNNHIIKNMYIKAPKGEFNGIFGGMWSSNVNNLTIKNVTLEGTKYAGVISGNCNSSVLENIKIVGDIKILNKATYFGGVLGYSYGNNIVNDIKLVVKLIAENSITMFGGISYVANTNDIFKNNIVKVDILNKDNPAEVTVDIQYYGGIVARIAVDDLTGCKIYNNIHASKFIKTSVLFGGIIGVIFKPMNDTLITHNINLSDMASQYAGGIIGYSVSKLNVDFCINKGNSFSGTTAGILGLFAGDEVALSLNNNVVYGLFRGNITAGLFNVQGQADFDIVINENFIFSEAQYILANGGDLRAKDIVAKDNITTLQVHSISNGEDGEDVEGVFFVGEEEKEHSLAEKFTICKDGNIILNKNTTL